MWSFGVRNGCGVDSVDEVLIGNNWGVLTSLPSFHGHVTVQTLLSDLTVTESPPGSLWDLDSR